VICEPRAAIYEPQAATTRDPFYVIINPVQGPHPEMAYQHQSNNSNNSGGEPQPGDVLVVVRMSFVEWQPQVMHADYEQMISMQGVRMS